MPRYLVTGGGWRLEWVPFNNELDADSETEAISEVIDDEGVTSWPDKGEEDAPTAIKISDDETEEAEED